MEKAIKTSSLNGSGRAVASQKLETVIKVCTGWLATCATSATSVRRWSRGFLLSARWVPTSFPNGDEVKSTVLQATLVPCSTTEPYHDGYSPCYRVLVYSFLPKEETELLRQRLQSITSRGGLALSLFWMKAPCYERLL